MKQTSNNNKIGGYMFGAKKKDHDIIKVAFYENDEAKPFSTSDIPIDQLPDTFAINTNLQIGDKNWHVVGSKPNQKTAFRKSGSLKLYLSKAEPTMMDPQDILFSLPTINDELPTLEKTKSLEKTIIFAEDDWRQREFISHDYKDAVHKEIADISEIIDDHKESSGFNKLHIRQAIKTPLKNKNITCKTIKANFEIVKTYDGVAFNTAAASLVGGFAFQTKTGWVLWGYVNNKDIVQVLNLFPTDEANAQGLTAIIDQFTTSHDLYLVDWPNLFCTGAK